MKEDIIAANLSSLRADIQALPQKIAEELNQNATEQSDSSLQIDETKVAGLISDAVSTALQFRLYDDEKYVDKRVSVFTELANMYNTVTANCNKNAETINRNIQLTEKQYAAMMKLMQEKKSKTIEQPPIPQTIKSLATIYFHVVSMVLDKEDVSKRALPPVPGYLHGLCPCRFCVPDDILGL